MKYGKKINKVDLLFNLGLLGKAIDGGLEIAGAVVLSLASPRQIHGVLRVLTLHELREDPHDLFAGLLLRSTQHLSTSTEVFAAIFLLVHGAVKVGLVWALLRRQRWAYPAAIMTFGLFFVYQVSRYAHTRSTSLLALSCLDVFVIVLTWLEYRRLWPARGVSP